ncbi:MAG: glutamate synthase [Oligoflexia bacterium]|nr:glutamate synthase [Oligoflexia bacterium]
MAELVPHPIDRLATRMFAELRAEDSIFGLPRAKFFLGDPDHDLSVRFHGDRVSSALGPAAGPHTQMAQNIVLSWLAGCRIMELKTVQINDRLEIPRPCIDMATVGFNVEWSQELRLAESLREYVKATMLIEILRHSGELPLLPGYQDVHYDMSVGYDLAGIQSAPVRAFLDGMLDAGSIIEEQRAALPLSLGPLRDLDFPTRLSSTLTLSTFHGCPPDEIEKIIDWLLHNYGLDCIVKLNPTLLGKAQGRHLLNDVLGYHDLVVPDDAYDADTHWDEMVDFVGSLGDTADRLGLGFGVKFSNTQIVQNNRGLFSDAESLMYLSGPPLHVLAMSLVQRFRRVFADRFPISFSAGIDRKNFADAVSLGIVPVTVCTDFLKPQGYGRGISYFKQLSRRMDAVAAVDVPSWTLLAQGQASAALDRAQLPDDIDAACRTALDDGGDLRKAAGSHFDTWLSQARLLNTERYVQGALADPRYRAEKNSRPPRKIDSTLVLLDCLTCDKCLPVCPNQANFRFTLKQQPLTAVTVWQDGDAWKVGPSRLIEIKKKHQIANFVDFCNDCGNCDVFCPELGGPYKLKARFHSSLKRFQAEADRDGLFVQGPQVWARVEGAVVQVVSEGALLHLQAAGVDLRFDPNDPAGTVSGHAEDPVDLGIAVLLDAVRAAVIDSGRVSYLALPASIQLEPGPPTA